MIRLAALLFAVAIASPAAALQVFDTAQNRAITPDALFDRMADADVVFLGELHDDAASHRFELRVLEALKSRGRPVALGLEMFERNQEPLLQDYLAGRIAEAEFLARVAPWSNYATDYRPLVEFAKTQGWPVIGTNVPRPIAAGVARAGLAALDGVDKTLVAHQVLCPDDAYRARFVVEMGGGAPHGPGMSKSALQQVYEAQCVKDETMAESLAAMLKPGATVVHVNGAFHSDARLGTVSRLLRRRPEAKVLVVSIVAEKALEPGRTLATSGVEADVLVMP